MHNVVVALLVVSLLLLTVVLFRRRQTWRWFGIMMLHVVVASFLLYFINLIGGPYDFRIPLNVPTVASVIVLGLPGVAMLIGLKLVVM